MSKRIPELVLLSGLNTAADDQFVIFDADTNETKRISRADLTVALGVTDGTIPVEFGTLATQNADNVSITGGVINGVTMNGVTMQSINLSSATLTNPTISGGTLTNSILSGGSAGGLTLTNPTASGGSASNLSLTNPTVSGGTITSSAISGGSASGTTLTNIPGSANTFAQQPGVAGNALVQVANGWAGAAGANPRCQMLSGTAAPTAGQGADGDVYWQHT